jgi:hypothetical protein
VVVAALGVSTVIAAVSSTPPPSVPSADRGTSDVAVEEPDATYQGVPVWWSPDQQEEQELRFTESPLPREVDLGGRLDRPDDPMEHALAAFARGRSVTLVGPDDAMRWVDLSGLQEVAKPNGYSYLPTSTSMLSPTGAYLAFLQPGHVAVYTVASGRWSDVDTGGGATDTSGGGGLLLTWVADDEFVVTGLLGGLDVRHDVAGGTQPGVRVGPFEPAFDWPPAQPYGRDVRSPGQHDAQSWGMGVPLPVRDPGTDLSDPEFLVTPGGVLAFMWKVEDGDGSRYKDCCPVAGWLDDDTVVYESRQTDALLVSWSVGSHEFGLISRIRGSYDVASFALGS